MPQGWDQANCCQRACMHVPTRLGAGRFICCRALPGWLQVLQVTGYVEQLSRTKKGQDPQASDDDDDDDDDGGVDGDEGNPEDDEDGAAEAATVAGETGKENGPMASAQVFRREASKDAPPSAPQRAGEDAHAPPAGLPSGRGCGPAQCPRSSSVPPASGGGAACRMEAPAPAGQAVPGPRPKKRHKGPMAAAQQHDQGSAAAEGDGGAAFDDGEDDSGDAEAEAEAEHPHSNGDGGCGGGAAGAQLQGQRLALSAAARHCAPLQALHRAAQVRRAKDCGGLPLCCRTCAQ